MDEVEELSLALVTLSQKILERQDNDRLTLVRQLLLDIDRTVFQSMFERWGCKTFLAIQQTIQSYYLSVLSEKIRWDCDLVRRYSDQFIEVFVFIIDLALKSGKDNYIMPIISMEENEQIALQPFVESVTQREMFVEPAPKPQDEKRKAQYEMELQEENDKLKVERESLLRRFSDLKESYDYLKASHDRLSGEVNFLKQERYQFINQLGGIECGSIEQTVEKVKRQLMDYQKIVQKLHKELEEKKNIIKQRDDDIRQFQNNFKANRYEEKSQLLEEVKKKNKELQTEIEAMKVKEDDTKMDIESLRETLNTKDHQIDSLRKQIGTLEIFQSKYLAIRKLHVQFKSKIIKDFKDFKE